MIINLLQNLDRVPAKNETDQAAKPYNEQAVVLWEASSGSWQLQLAYCLISVSPSLTSIAHSDFSAILRAYPRSKSPADCDPDPFRVLLAFGGEVDTFAPVVAAVRSPELGAFSARKLLRVLVGEN
jgi:hypothetical protein